MRRTLAIAITVSAVVLSLFVVLVPGSERGSLGRWNSDHYSHYSAVILFWHRGFAIYDTPVRELCDPTTATTRSFAAAHELEPEAMCDIAERAGRRPLSINWSDFPRPYPPGQLLFHAPEAMLYAHTDLSRYWINRLTVIKDLLAGHVVVWLLLSALLLGPDDDDRRMWRSLARLVVPVVYFGIVPASVVGFYDPISIACICLAIDRMRSEKPIGAIMWLSLAVFLHLRASWYVPLGLACLLQLRSPEHRGELATARGKLALVIGMLALGLATVAITRLAPYLARFPETNRAMFLREPLSPGSLDLLFLLALVASFLVRDRQWLLLVVIGWQALVIGTTYQVQTWHGMFFIPLLALARWKCTSLLTTGAVLVFIVGVSRLVFNAAPMPGMFLSHLLHGNL